MNIFLTSDYQKCKQFAKQLPRDSNEPDFANMFWSISMKILTEIGIHLKRPCQSIIFVPRVLGACRSVFNVSNVSDK